MKTTAAQFSPTPFLRSPARRAISPSTPLPPAPSRIFSRNAGVKRRHNSRRASEACGDLRIERVERDDLLGPERVAGAVGGVELRGIAAAEAENQRARAIRVFQRECRMLHQLAYDVDHLAIRRRRAAWLARRTTCRSRGLRVRSGGRNRPARRRRPSHRRSVPRPPCSSADSAAERSVMLSALSYCAWRETHGIGRIVELAQIGEGEILESRACPRLPASADIRPACGCAS